MALQAWVGRSAAQLDADSPLDITLHNSYDDDLIHLRQVLYGDGAGTFNTPIDGHNHDPANSEALATSAAISDEIITAVKIAKSILPGARIMAASELWYPNIVLNAFSDSTTEIRLEVNHTTIGWIDTASTVGQTTLFDSSGNVRFRNSNAGATKTLNYQLWN